MISVSKALVLGSLSLALCACGSPKDATKGNFDKAIQAFLDTQKGLCAGLPGNELPFSLADSDNFMGVRDRAEALVTAGLLNKKVGQVKARFGNRVEPGAEYSLTELGRKYLVPHGANTMGRQDAFCSGKYAVVEVENFTEPSEVMGAKISRVNFRYRLDDAADWTRTKELGAAYGEFAKQAGKDIEGKAMLVLTNNGWVHERLFSR